MELGADGEHARRMTDMRGLPKKYESQLIRAREQLTVGDEVGLALRAHRRRLGLNQRNYADQRGLSRAMLARLEAGAGRLSLDTAVRALEGTGFELRVGFASPPPETPEAAAAVADRPPTADDEEPSLPLRGVPAECWQPTDLIARVRGGSRRFPAHRQVEVVVNPPFWWWIHEFFAGPSEEPEWYAPMYPRMKPRIVPSTMPSPTDDPENGAA